MDFGCYGAVLATWMLDGQRPTEVRAIAHTVKPERYPDVDDDATIVLSYPGATAVIAILFLVPAHHASISDVFTKTINNSGMFGGATSGWGWLLFVLPISAILTQYTITGYDASAHLSEETKSAADAAITAPSPSNDSVIAVKSPRVTPATNGVTDRLP